MTTATTILGILSLLQTVNSALATSLPAPKSGTTGIYPSVYAIVNAIALNFGHAKNATAP